MYANDGITINLKTLFVWTATDPYTGPSKVDYFDQFGNYRTQYDGDVGHLIGYGGSGGMAWMMSLCNYNQSVQTAYSGITSSYNNVPTYSWTLNCIAHEEGHMLGSVHTNDCFWNGNNTKIDACADYAGYPSGTCPLVALSVTQAQGGGTIMSYCHLNIGINFSLGFGPQPRDYIISYINYTSCLSSCGCAPPGAPTSLTGSTSTCPNSIVTYTASAVTGATSYSWTLPSGWTGTSTTNTITCTAGSASGTIIVTANSSCGSSTPKTLSVTVAVPAQPGTISGNATVCSGTSQTYSVAAITGATSYTWTLPSGWSGSSTSTLIATTTGTSGGSITVKANNTCGSSAPQNLNATCSTLAQPGAISGSTSICPNSSQTYSIAAIPGATSYTWTLPSGWTGSSTTNSIATTTGSIGGTLTIKANNNCGSSPAQSLNASLSPAPSPAGSITGNSTVCKSSSQTYQVNVVTGATGYTWTLPSGWTGSSTSNSIITTAGTNNGTITVAVNNNCGSSAPQTLPVAVTTTVQPGTITGNTSICALSSQSYSVAPVTGATSYTWTLPSGWIGTSSVNSITAVTGTAGGTITLKANNDCGTGAAQSLSVAISPIPAQPSAMTGNSYACIGSLQTYSVPSVSGATSYIWTIPLGWIGISTTNSINLTAGIVGGTISVKPVNACGVIGTARSLAVSVQANAPVQPGTISGKALVCKNSSQTYSVSSVSGATSYTWTLPIGWTGSSTTKSITVIPGDSSGVISVKANNVCGSSISRTLAVSTVPSLPLQPGLITGNITVCKYSKQEYQVSPFANAASYIWTMPSGWSGSSVVDSILPTVGSSGGLITVKAVNVCGSSATRTLPVTVLTVPAQPSPITSATNLCSGSTGNYAVLPVTGALSYTWTLPNGWTGTSIINSINATAGTSNGNVIVKANNSCGSSTTRSLAVTATTSVPAKPGAITGSLTPTANSTQTYAINAVTGATSYTWVLPYGWSGTSTTKSITVTVGTSGGTISVVANNSCGASITQTAFITVPSGLPRMDVSTDQQTNASSLFTMFPNPTLSDITLSFKEGINEAIVEIYNLAGGVIFNKQFSDIADSPSKEIHLNAAPGIYMVRVTESGKQVIQRLVIQ